MEVFLTKQQIDDLLTSLTKQVSSDLGTLESLVIVGIRSRGEILAQRLCEKLSTSLKRKIPCGTLDITLYRDDLHGVSGENQPTVRSTEIDFDINGKTILLIDDVLQTGRSIRAAMAALMDLGRPQAVRLGVLIDRGCHELPISADYIGTKADISSEKSIQVYLMETDQQEQVIIE